MQLSVEVIDKVEELASLFYTPTEVARILQLSKIEFENAMDEPTSELYIAYNTGYFTADVALRTSVKKVAIMGSSPAQTLLQKIIDNNKMSRI